MTQHATSWPHMRHNRCKSSRAAVAIYVKHADIVLVLEIAVAAVAAVAADD